MTTHATAITANAGDMLAEVLRPNPVEVNYEITKIEGEIPRELCGTLYRNGPCQKVLPTAGAGAMHLFDGDGLVQAISFENGKARHRSRFARTESFLREQQEGVYMGGINVPTEAVLEEPPPGVSPNTNIVEHGGRLLALVENAPPFEMTPGTLESRGPWEYDGKMVGISTTAHPKIDRKTGQMLIHGYAPIEPYLQLYVVEADGTVSLAEALECPWPSMMHDFAITENYVIFPLGSYFFDFGPIEQGGGFADAIQARPDLNMKFGVRRREAGSPIRWIDASVPGFMFHPGNAYEKDGKIFMDSCTYEDPQGLLDDIRTIRSGNVSNGFGAHPYLYEIDVAAGTCRETKLSEMSAEFPRLDDRRVGYENRFGYAATADPVGGAEALFRRITKYDRHNRTSVHRETVPGQWVGEPVFVPRSPEAAEDDGFVLNVLYDAPGDRSAIDVLDALAIDSAPLARVWLDERIPLGFHGNFSPAG